MNVGLFIPCFVDSFFPSAAIATWKLLKCVTANVHYPEQQTCCGQAHYNAGLTDHARKLAQRFCRIFEPYDWIVCPSGSCTAMVRCHYAPLVPESKVPSRVFELCEFLVNIAHIEDFGATLQARAAVHIGCHSQRMIDIAQPVSQLLHHVRGLHVVTTQADRWCCGFGGTFSVKYPEISVRIGETKLHALDQTDIDYLISTDCSCSLHLNGLLDYRQLQQSDLWDSSLHSKIQIVYIAEVLASHLADP